jgi:ATP-dependent Lon protease
MLDKNNPLVREWSEYKVNRKEFIVNIRKTLDSTVYGHKEAKIQLERIFAQWINGDNKGAILGLQGPPGTGKTSLAKNGLSKCLIDIDGKPRHFSFLPIGGSVNGSTLVGHNYTYVGSTWGRIVDILISANCMNPIIFIDEIDKVSHTEHGREIISILTHLTDSTQNNEFEDKFFAGIKLDLSKALIVFSFNNPDLIDPILKDRITIIETHPLSLADKLVVIKDYMLPEICKDVGLNRDEIIISDEMIRYLIETYTVEAGVRKIKEKMVDIIRDINLNRLYNNNDGKNEYSLPFTITKDYIKVLFENKPKVVNKMIHQEPAVGLVNGLYATISGLGGITIIQLTKFPSDKFLDINLTGKAGDVMKESVQYSLKVAWSLLTKKEQTKLVKDNEKKKGFGIHIHCPDGATPKDGPSAGAAFTLALYSILTNKKINNTICMTGEIDLLGNITKIGGVEYKLSGGKKAGCKIALIPQENMEDIEILRKEGKSPEDDMFKIIPVSCIKQVIKLAIV